MKIMDIWPATGKRGVLGRDGHVCPATGHLRTSKIIHASVVNVAWHSFDTALDLKFPLRTNVAAHSWIPHSQTDATLSLGFYCGLGKKRKLPYIFSLFRGCPIFKGKSQLMFQFMNKQVAHCCKREKKG